MLTERAKEVIRRVVLRGESTKDAYAAVYGKCNERAYRLLKEPEAVAYMAELRGKLEQSGILEKEELMRRILETAEGEDVSVRDRLRGYEIYGKMAGYAAPQVQVQNNTQVIVATSFSAVMERVRRGASQ